MALVVNLMEILDRSPGITLRALWAMDGFGGNLMEILDRNPGATLWIFCGQWLALVVNLMEILDRNLGATPQALRAIDGFGGNGMGILDRNLGATLQALRAMDGFGGNLTRLGTLVPHLRLCGQWVALVGI